MRAPFALAMAFLLAPLSGCLALAGAGDDGASYRPLAEGQRATVQEPRVVIVEDEKAWRATWSLTGRTGPPPDVDFEKERVVAVFAGTRPHGGWSVAVTDVRHDARGDLVVEATTLSPHPGGLYTMALVHPYAMVAVPADGTPVVVEQKEQVAPAPDDT